MAKVTKKPTQAVTPPAPEADWQAQAEANLLGWQRTQADFENYRRRMEEQRQNFAALAAAETTIRLTPILDDFRRAFLHLPPDQEQSAWVQGMRQVEKHLRSILATAGLQAIEDGGPFDPALHEAIVYEDHPEHPDGTIIDIVEIGWKLGDRVIKPAKVRVSRGHTETPN